MTPTRFKTTPPLVHGLRFDGNLLVVRFPSTFTNFVGRGADPTSSIDIV